MARSELTLTASILLVERGVVPRVFRVRRRRDAPFLSDFHCFPGGKADAADEAMPLTGAEGLSPDERRARAAALRETFEEAGVLLTAEGPVSALGRSFEEAVEAHGPPHAGDLVPVGRWLTPPYVGTRYETRFYLALVPEGAGDDLGEVAEDHPELSEGAWVRPSEAVREWQTGASLLAPPGIALLKGLVEGWAETPERFLERPEACGEVPRWSPVFPHLTLFPVATPTLPPATHTNCYVVGEQRLLIFDPASPWTAEREALDAYLDDRLAAGAAVEAIVLTHHHQDHVSGAAHLAQRLGCPILAHPETAARVDFKVDRPLDEGDVLRYGDGADEALAVFFTPGHAPGHLCFVDQATGAAIVGDMVAGVGTILVEPVDGDMAAYLAQLERLEAMDLRCLMASHGPIMGGAKEKLRQYIDHRLAREARVVAALSPEPTPIDELLPRVYGDVVQAAWPLARLSLEAHLLKLSAEGRAVSAQGARGWRAS